MLRLPSTEHEFAKPVFARSFKEFGSPAVIRADNGVPFATTALSRLSRLSVWGIRLGIYPELTEPGPSSLYQRSQREMPPRLPEIEYPPHLEARYVSTTGGIRFNWRWVNISRVL